MSAPELIKDFLEYFMANGHTLVPSSPLVPRDDPTLLFTSAGMVQFKPLFAGVMELPYRRAVTCQKCFRLTDLGNVGRTVRHLTFFEMLGNFSFGDYFKQEAIAFAMEFIREHLKLAETRLWATVYEEDEEAARLWEGFLPRERIVALGVKDNFWGPAGKTGACGPCSEIYWDMGSEFGCSRSECKPGCDCDRYLEFWNLVFPQFFKNEKGELEPLRNRGIDTGMGVERLAMIVEGAPGLFETSLFAPLLRMVKEVLEDEKLDALTGKILADHCRALCFLIADGVNPSNEGRGYVVRRLLRRAALFAHLAGHQESFIARLASPIIDLYHDRYPELLDRASHISTVLAQEEEGFARTLQAGLNQLTAMMERAREESLGILSGSDVFLLHDTYGFPPELTAELLHREGMNWDETGYAAEMEKQRSRSRAGSGLGKLSATHFDEMLGAPPPSLFIGYEQVGCESIVQGLFNEDGEVLDHLDGGTGWVAFTPTPFYAEGGGQVADAGELTWQMGSANIIDVKKTPAGWHLHRVEMKQGELMPGQKVWAQIDLERRRDIERHHTATHLIHRALRQILGPDAVQAGSLVAPDRLRFDFHFSRKLTADELQRVEEHANRDVWDDLPVAWEQMPMDKARNLGAMALFGEKYGDVVRVVSVVGEEPRNLVCAEFCGGTHVRYTGEIGQILILSEEAVAAGVRRIEAVAGKAAYEWIKMIRNKIVHVSSELEIPLHQFEERILNLYKEHEKDRKLLADLEMHIATEITGHANDRDEIVGDIIIYSRYREGIKREALREVADFFRSQRNKAIVLVGAPSDDGKLMLVLAISKDLVTSYNANSLLQDLVIPLGGKGGGKADFAQGGSPNPKWFASIAIELINIIKKSAESNK